MASRRADKQRLHQKQAARQRQCEQRAKRRERRIYVGLAAGLLLLATVAAVIVVTRSSRTSSPLLSPAPKAFAPVSSTPLEASARAELTANVSQANQILNITIQAKLAHLHGVPVVINQWASWCTNCRFEFPFFQRAGRGYASRVAFVGLDSQDSRSSAQAFLRRSPVDYPSVFDPSASQAQALGGGQGWPTTIFMNARHQITYVHVGAYPSLRVLQQDIGSYT